MAKFQDGFARKSLLAVLAGSILIVAGCYKVTGGGWIAGVNGGKATFGFEGRCVDENDPFFGAVQTYWKGNFQYNDHSARVRINGELTPSNSLLGAPVSNCRDVDVKAVEYGLADFVNGTEPIELTGTCVTKGGVQGTFQVIFTDSGNPKNSLNGDEILVRTPRILEFDEPVFDADGNFLGFNHVVIPLGAPCTDDGQPYQNSGIIGGGNLVVHVAKNS